MSTNIEYTFLILFSYFNLSFISLNIIKTSGMMVRRKFLKILALTPLMRVIISALSAIGLGAYLGWRTSGPTWPHKKETREENLIYLPLPKLKGDVSLEEALSSRRSIREYTKEPISLEQLAQILWAAYGISEIRWGFRTAPSAGAQYPLEVYVVISERGVRSDSSYLEPGIYHYIVKIHALEIIKKGDFRKELYKAALNQEWVRDAPVNLVITAIYERTTWRYGERGIRYVHMDLGHLGQNIYLQATAMGLGTVAIGAFYDDDVREVLGVGSDERPLYIMPLGVAAWRHKITLKELESYYKKHGRV